MRGKGISRHRVALHRGITPAYAGKSQSYRQPCSAMWDHPRVCGEKSKPKPGKDRRMESPPRVRGKGISRHRVALHRGITPAYAGKSQSYRQPCSAMWDHPRVCGEKSKPKPGKDRRMESPPRVRGKGISRHRVALHRGITPAYAGKSQSYRQPCSAMWDHPRVCGEKAPE